MSEEVLEQDIIGLTHKILSKLNLEIPEEELEGYEFLTSDSFFIQIFTTFLGDSTTYFDEEEFLRETEGMNEGQRIQALIDKLDSDILHIYLVHIKGEKIAEGNMNHIKNLLQLLNALICSEEDEEQNMGASDTDNKGGVETELDYEKALNGNESLDEEIALNIDHSSDRVRMNENMGQYDGFVDATEALNSDENLEEIMARDGGLDLPSEGRTGRKKVEEDDGLGSDEGKLAPKMTKAQMRKRPVKKKKPKKGRKKKMRGKSARYIGMKQQIVGKIEDNIYGKKRKKNLKRKVLTKNQVSYQELTSFLADA